MGGASAHPGTWSVLVEIKQMKFAVNFRGMRSCVAKTPDWFLNAPEVDQDKAGKGSPLLQKL